MTLKVPFKAVPNFKKKPSWLAVSVSFGFASSLLTIALPLAFAQSNAENEDRTIERGNIAVTKSVQSNPLGGTSIVYAKTRLTESARVTETESASKNATISTSPASSTSTTALPNLADTKLEQSAKIEISPATLPAESFFTPAITSEPAILQKDILLQPTPKGLKVMTDQTDAEKALIKKYQAKKARAKIADSEQLVMNKKNEIAEEVDLGLTATEKVIPTPKSNRPASMKAKQPTIEEIVIDKLEFNRANMLDVARALADMSGLNFVATEEAAKKNVTVFLQKISVKNALEAITKNAGLWYRRDKESGTFRIMSTKEYQQDLIVYREDATRVFSLLHPNPSIVATAIRDLYGDRVILSFGMPDMTMLGGGMGMGMGGGGGMSGGMAGGMGMGGGRGGVGGGRGGRGGMGGGMGMGMGGGGMGMGGGGMGMSGGGMNRSPVAGRNGGGQAGNQMNDNNIVQDNLTVDQLQKLNETIIDKGDASLNMNDLKGINNQQQPIFITINQEHDLMVVRTSDTGVMKEIESLVKELDRPTKQVLLEMKILSLDVGDAYRQSMDLDYMPSSNTVSGPITDQSKNPLGTIAPINVTNTSTIDNGNGNTSTQTQSGITRLGVRNILGLGNFALEGGTFVYQFLNDTIRARIQLLQQNNRVNTLSSPILLTSNNKTAQVFVGTEQVVTTGFDAIAGGASVAGVGAPAIIPITELRNIGNTLVVMPKINTDKTVTLMIQQDTSTLIRGASTIPIPVGNNIQSFNVDSVRTSNIQGTVQAKDGLTIAIGGLIDSTDSEEQQQIPILGDFPIIGELFKRKVQQKSKRELLLLITPHIIESAHQGEDLTRDALEPLTEQQW